MNSESFGRLCLNLIKFPNYIFLSFFAVPYLMSDAINSYRARKDTHRTCKDLLRYCFKYYRAG